jgi:Flp pilus assembly protein TadG
LVEFAFVAPIFFLLIFAMIDFGRYVYYVQVLNNAAREGARYAIVHGSNSFQPAGPSPNDPAVQCLQ